MAQPKENYYTPSTLDGKCGRDLELALKAIIHTHRKIEYGDAWKAFESTDEGPTDSIPEGFSKQDLVYDMYAWMKHLPKFYSDNDHTQTGGINREHCVPNSWWGGESGNSVAYTDLHNLFPGDGAVNNAKNDNPLGEHINGMSLLWPKEDKVNSRGYTYVTFDNPASHLWMVTDASDYEGSTKVFEPTDEYKGDFARAYLYMVCAYEGEITWKPSSTFMFYNDDSDFGHTGIRDWAKTLLLKWHRQDPVSIKERNRNNAVETIQENRNPFVDYPELVEYVWGNKSSQNDFCMANAVCSYSDEYNNDSKSAADIIIEFHVKMGENFISPALQSSSDGRISYSSSNPDVAVVDAETGAVTIIAPGKATITATTQETDVFDSSEAMYDIVVE